MATHVTDAGEDVQTIARRHGYFDPQTVWEDPANASLASERDSPFVLAPGDEIEIPALVPAKRVLTTNTRHFFFVPRPARRLRVRLLGLDGEALEGSVELGGEVVELEDGAAQIELETQATEVALEHPTGRHTLTIAGLDPVDTDAGLITRLAALGYDVSLDDLRGPQPGDRVGFAIELFQLDNGLEVGAPIDDALRDALTEAFGA